MVTVYPSFFFNDTATTEIYTLFLHDALPIYAFQDIAHGEQQLLCSEPRGVVERDERAALLHKRPQRPDAVIPQSSRVRRRIVARQTTEQFIRQIGRAHV